MGTPVSAPKLPLALRRLAEAMAHGIDTSYFPGTHREIAPGTPLPFRLAALAVGCRVRRAEAAAMTKPFLDALAAEVALRRENDDPSKLALAIETRDNGDAPDARLEAIEALRGKQPVRPTLRKLGQLMASQRAAGLMADGGDARRKSLGSALVPSESQEPIPLTLAEVGIDKHLADRARKAAAALPEEEFEEKVAEPEKPDGFFPAPWLEKEGRVPPLEPPAPALPPGVIGAHPLDREVAFKGRSQPGAYQRPRAIRVAPRLGQHR